MTELSQDPTVFNAAILSKEEEEKKNLEQSRQRRNYLEGEPSFCDIP